MSTRRKRKKRRQPIGKPVEPELMTVHERRSANRTLVAGGALCLLILGAMLWHTATDAMSQLAVFVPAGSEVARQWVRDLRDAGLHVRVIKETDAAARRDRLHIPVAFAADVSAITENPARYVLSGYVPPDAVLKMLREKPASIHGLMVPDSPESMAIGSSNASMPLDVWAFWSDGYKELYVHQGPPATR